MKKSGIIVGVIAAVLLLGIFLIGGSRNSLGYGDREQRSALISEETAESDAETYVTGCSSQEDMSVLVTDNDIRDMETYLYVDETNELWQVFTSPKWLYEYEEIPYADEDTYSSLADNHKYIIYYYLRKDKVGAVEAVKKYGDVNNRRRINQMYLFFEGYDFYDPGEKEFLDHKNQLGF